MNDINSYLKNEEFITWISKRRLSRDIYFSYLSLKSKINTFEMNEMIDIFNSKVWN